MDYEIITVFEYYGNNLGSTHQAKLYANGTLEYFPEPDSDYPDEEEFEEQVSEEDEEDFKCMGNTMT